MKGFRQQLFVLALALLIPAGAAQALPAWLAGSTVIGSAGPQGNTLEITAMMLVTNSANTVENADSSVTFMNGSMTMAGLWEWTWSSITLDPDPIVSFVGGFKNISGVAQDFVFSTSTPIAPALATTLYGGSTIVTYGDANGNGTGGLSNDTSSNPAYTGTIDGIGTLNMLTLLNLTPLFPGDATQSASQNLGLPGPSIPGGAANSSIGILHRFNLSAGDQATFNSTFLVVPEPGTAVLFACGLAGLALQRRRRQA